MLHLQHLSAEAERYLDLVHFDSLLGWDNRGGRSVLDIAKRFSFSYVVAQDWTKWTSFP